MKGKSTRSYKRITALIKERRELKSKLFFSDLDIGKYRMLWMDDRKKLDKLESEHRRLLWNLDSIGVKKVETSPGCFYWQKTTPITVTECAGCPFRLKNKWGIIGQNTK